jgi:hypothetical protein
MDFYSVLGVHPRKKAMEYYPDRNPGDENALRRFKEIQQAYEVLCPKTTTTFTARPNPRTQSKAPKTHERKVIRGSIYDAPPPPTHDLWGNPLSPLQRAEWSRNNATDIEKIHNLRKTSKDFIDSVRYENGSLPDIRG